MTIFYDWVEAYPLLSYVLISAVIAGVVVVAISYFLAKRRIDRIQQWKKFNVFPPPAEIAKHVGTENAREQAIISINTHLINTRRLLFPLIMLIVLIVAAVPYTGKGDGTFISIIIGALTIVMGTAVKPIVENFFAGLVLGFSKLLNIGDLVDVNGVIATVEDINMTHTTLKRWDWTRYIIPNSKMLQLDYCSWTLREVFVQTHSDFWVAYDTDLDHLQEMLLKTAHEDGMTSPEKPGLFRVLELEEHGILCRLAVWTESSVIWLARHNLRKTIVKTLQREGIKTSITRISRDAIEDPLEEFRKTDAGATL